MVGPIAPGAPHDDATLSDEPSDTESKPSTDFLKGFLEPARNLRRVIDLYCNIHMVFLNGYTIMESLAGQDIYGDDDINRVICELAEEKHWDINAYMGDWRLFNALLDVIPGLRVYFDNTPDMDVLLKLAKEMNLRANNARATDAHTLKEAIRTYIPNWSASAADSDTKAQRGFNNLQYTQQLIPARYARQFRDDPIGTRANLLDGTLVVSPRYMPSFVYPHPEDYTPETVAEGMFRGPILLRVARHILMGPNVSSNAKVQPGSGGNANKHRITRMTPEFVAYIVVQVYFAMSSTTIWNGGSGKGRKPEFDYSVLYYTVINMFQTIPDEEENTWAQETLEWLNIDLYGHREGLSGALAPLPGIDEDEDDDWLRMIKSRAAQRMAKALLSREATADIDRSPSPRLGSLTPDSPLSLPEFPVEPPIDPALLATPHEPPVPRTTPVSSHREDPFDLTTRSEPRPTTDHSNAVVPSQSGGTTKRMSPCAGEISSAEQTSARPRRKTTNAGTSQGKKPRALPTVVAKRSTRLASAGANATII